MIDEVRPDRQGGWSRIPLRTQLPAVVLVAALGLAALYRPAAPFTFVAVLALYLLLRWGGRRSGALAAVLPVAAILMWRALPAPGADPLGGDCANLLAPPAVWRFLEGAIGLVAVVALVIHRRGSFAELGLRRGSRRLLMLSVLALLVVTPLALYFGVVVGGDLFGDVFFGSYRLDLSQPAALAPALVFAVSNAVAEELAYRGAMRAWLTPSLGIVGANLAQAIVFGLAHTGEDFVGASAAIPTAAAMVLVGFVGGVIVRRTGSLTLVLAVHLAADIPIYYYWACRVG